jgi:hypothetical protein
MYASAQYISIISIIPNNMNRKINTFFWFLFSWKLTPVRDDRLVNLVPPFIIPDFYHLILSIFFYTSAVFSPVPILTFLRLRHRHSRMTHDTRFVHRTAPSNCSAASARGHVRSIVISNISVASRMGQAARSCNISVAATEKLPVRALSYKAVFSIRATK